MEAREAAQTFKEQLGGPKRPLPFGNEENLSPTKCFSSPARTNPQGGLVYSQVDLSLRAVTGSNLPSGFPPLQPA